MAKRGVNFKEDIFSERELNILKQVTDIFRDARAEQMVEVSHLKNHPWERTLKTKGSKKRIDYNLALDGSDDQLDPEIIEERKKEIAEMENLRYPFHINRKRQRLRKLGGGCGLWGQKYTLN